MAWGFLNTLGGALGDTMKKAKGIVPTGGGTPPALPTGARTPAFNPAIAAPAIGKPAAPAVALPRLPEAGMNPPPMAPPMNPPPNPGRGILPGGSLDKRGVPIPALPGHGTEPTPYDPVSSRRYDYVMEGAKRDAEGNLSGGFKRSGKDVLKSLLVGAGTGMAATGSPWGALGGMAAGAGGTALAPQQGREMLFDELEMPQIRAQQARQMEQQKLEDEAFRRESERARMEQDALMGRERIAGIQAQAEADRARAEDLRREKFRDAPWGTYSERTGNVNYERPAGAGTPARPQGLMNTREGIYDPASRQWLERFDTSKPPSEADRRADERQRAAAMKDSQAFLVKFNDLKNDLIKTEANLSDPEVQQNPALYQSYAAQAATMKAQLADLAQFANDNYGDTLEGGPGQGGYAYVKPRPGGRAAMPRTGGGGGQKGTVGPEYVNFIAESLKVPPDEARRRLEADGYKVRQ